LHAQRTSAMLHSYHKNRSIAIPVIKPPLGIEPRTFSLQD
jgi:hypothetical protein